MTRPTADRLRLTVQIIWIAGFLVGTASHVLDVIAGGADTYGEFPLALRAFWLSLTALDPLTAMLLLLRRRVGIILGLVVVVADIAVNGSVFFTLGGNPLYGVVNQTLFAVFLLVTAPVLWRWYPSAPARRHRPPQE